MKRCRLSYDEWKCIVSKNIIGKRIQQDLLQKDITQERHDLAVNICDKLKNGILHDISLFKEFTKRCYEVIS